MRCVAFFREHVEQIVRTGTTDGVTINGLKNIPAYLPASSTWMFANNIYNFLKHLVRDGNVTVDRNDEIIGPTLVTTGGEIVHAGTLEAMDGGVA